MKLYVDMDGVLTDFIKQLSKLLGKPLEYGYEFGNDPKIWGKIEKAGKNFWADMKWMPDGKKLWDEIKDKKPTILSAPTEHKSSIEGKKEWLSENLPEAPYIIEQEKEKYADKGAVLIDDRESNIEKWEKAGGTGILHKNTKDTLEKLSKIMKNAAKESMEKLDIVAGMLEAEGLLKEAMHVDAIANSLQEFVENGTRQMK